MKIVANGVSHGERNRRPDDRRKFRPTWVALGAILIIYVFSALRTKPTASFGILQDDGLYFSSAKALATGQGYILPEFPGRLRSMKYPKLYPLILAGVWKLDPNFPGNLKFAVGLTLGFGCAFLVFAFLMLRGWRSMTDWAALVVAALCVLSGEFLQLSASLMSDVPFCAMALGSAYLATRSLRRRGHAGLVALGAGLLAGFSVGFKSLGLAFAAGIGLSFLLHRRYRLLGWFFVSALPLAMLWFWPALWSLVHSTGGMAGSGLTDSGWKQTVCYYSSYGCAWRMGVSNFASLEAIVRVNLIRVFLSPGVYLLAPLGTGNVPGMILVTLASVAAYAGSIRHAKSSGWDPLPLILAFYLLMIVPWPWTPDRFLLVFLPLIFGGLWLEGERLAALALRYLKQGTGAERAIAGILAACVVATTVAALVNNVYSIPASQRELGSEHAEVLADERGAYAWIRQHTAPDARILAYEDGLTYLYTGRPSIQPLVTLPQSFFQHEAVFSRQDSAHLGDVAAHVHSSYWLTSPYDSNFEDPGKFGMVQARQHQLLADAPVVYRSPDGYVVLYDTRCLWETVGRNCDEPGKGR